MYTHARTHARTRAYEHTHAHTHMNTHINTHSCSLMHTHNIRTVHSHTHTHTQIHIHVRTHTHDHTLFLSYAHLQYTRRTCYAPYLPHRSTLSRSLALSHTHTHKHTHTHTTCAPRLIAMGWLRLVGSLKWQVSFAKETYKRDDILQKRRIVIVATPYHFCLRTSRVGVASISRLLQILCLFCRVYRLFYRSLLQMRPVILRSLPIVATPYHFGLRTSRVGVATISRLLQIISLFCRRSSLL